MGSCGSSSQVPVVVRDDDRRVGTLASGFTNLDLGSANATMPIGYTPGVPLTVTIAVTPPASVSAQAVEDTPPAGWTVTNISHSGQFDNVNHKVKWGPFFDADPRTLTYQVTAPMGTIGVQTFSGLASFDGVDIPITGARSLTLAIVPAPAGISPTSGPAAGNTAGRARTFR